MEKILLVDDEKNILIILHALLTEAGYSVKTADSGELALRFAKDFEPDLLVTDLTMKDKNGIETMYEIQTMFPDIKTIIMTAHGSIPSAVEAIKDGAYDYITKPFDNDDFLLLIKRALEVKELKHEVRELQNEVKKQYDVSSIIGQSSLMDAVFKRIQKISSLKSTVLIYGESGTGKELVAKAIHYSSPRCDNQFVAVNCGAIPRELIESEFFGHEKGSFTGALFNKKGKFEEAHKGTLFLDEVGELSPDAQVKFLRVLQEFEFMKVGGNKPIKVDTRVIAATNKNLAEEIIKGTFREDLYYRLNIFPIEIPPLRKRKEDIPLLIDHFIEKYNKTLGTRIEGIEREVLDTLMKYDWYGNVRELENVIHQSIIEAEKNSIRLKDLPSRIRYNVAHNNTDERSLGNHITQESEKDLILKRLKENLGSRGKTAHDLGISRTTLFLKMKKYGIG